MARTVQTLSAIWNPRNFKAASLRNTKAPNQNDGSQDGTYHPKPTNPLLKAPAPKPMLGVPNSFVKTPEPVLDAPKPVMNAPKPIYLLWSIDHWLGCLNAFKRLPNQC